MAIYQQPPKGPPAITRARSLGLSFPSADAAGVVRFYIRLGFDDFALFSCDVGQLVPIAQVWTQLFGLGFHDCPPFIGAGCRMHLITGNRPWSQSESI
jgi:hypothetical protein